MTRSPRPVRAIASLALVAIALTGCSFLPTPGPDGASGGSFSGDSVTVRPLFVAGDSGGVSEQQISATPSEDGTVRLDFSENEVTGFGDLTRAASWNAVSVTTALTGADLSTQYRFAFDGRIDGPSAGALTTVGLLSLYYGDEIDEAATMTGTINPTGTVGTVGGIPEKIQGVIDDGTIERVLIPLGQRNSVNARGELVDVVDLGASADVEVIEVGTIYEAYEQLTGATLPAPESPQPRVSEVGYDKLASAAQAALARFDRARAEFDGLDPLVRESAADAAAQAQTAADRARSLQTQGLQAGAFIEASNAALLMGAVQSTFSTVQSLLLGDVTAFTQAIAASESAIAEFEAQIGAFNTYTPESITDAEALTAAYGNAFDSYSLLVFAQGQLQVIADRIANAEYTDFGVLVQDALLPLIFFEFARGQLVFSQAVFDVGRDAPGGAISEGADLDAIATFLRQGAEANWAAFETGVIAPAAERNGVSNDVFRTQLGGIDFDVALAYSALQAQPAIEGYIGDAADNADYAAAGYGYLNYARNAVLIEKYYNNGVLDENLTLVGVSSDAALTAALDLGREQLGRSLGVLEAEGTGSVLAVGSYEVGGVLREGDVTQKFGAIAQYSGAFVLTRAMAYLGGFPTEGWAREE